MPTWIKSLFKSQTTPLKSTLLYKGRVNMDPAALFGTGIKRPGKILSPCRNLLPDEPVFAAIATFPISISNCFYCFYLKYENWPGLCLVEGEPIFRQRINLDEFIRWMLGK
jgi:hypothetical protein